MPSYLLLVSICAGAATLGTNNLDVSMTLALGYLAAAGVAGVGLVLKFKAEILAGSSRSQPLG
jgi:hypothetical protein